MEFWNFKDTFMEAPETVDTARLRLRRPTRNDAAAIFFAYSSDADVTRFLAWPRHRTLEDTHAFLEFSDAEWQRAPAGPYLIELASTGTLIGGAGLSFEEEASAQTGYVLAKGYWGLGYATEALTAITMLAFQLKVSRLYALCHVQHVASQRVLEKCGFAREAIMERHSVFPNFDPDQQCDVVRYARAHHNSA